MRAILVTLLCTCALAASAVARADLYTPFQAQYEVYHGSSSLGGGRYELEKLAENRYRLGYESAVKYLFLSDKRTEHTEFTVTDEGLMPQHYRMERSGSGPDFGAEITFDHGSDNIHAQYKKRQAEFELTPPIYDSLLYQQQLRLDVANGVTEMYYPFIQKTGRREYHFKVTGTETLKLPFGTLETVKIERIRDPNSEKETIFWLVPELDYIVARLAHFEEGKLKADMQLKQVEFEP
ncbi:DUF3108 domain-containing protein [Ferrimonas gelatinilytica]|uniref:DUF3108 domain-containing protein n=1 Tax=Ferrimonas gelatinilytica TaxID=1255257 RepID=A0ABP9RW19_9GAMM